MIVMLPSDRAGAWDVERGYREQAQVHLRSPIEQPTELVCCKSHLEKQ